MKGIKINNSYFAKQGSCSSARTNMVSVGGLIAYKYREYCYPDGNSYGYGFTPDGHYLLQHEIELVEYDRTVCNQYGSGEYDVCTVIDLPEVFWVTEETKNNISTYLVGILNTKNKLIDIPGKIYHVREHEGHYLHVYHIESAYSTCKREDFDSTILAIKEAIEKGNLWREEMKEKKYRDVELPFHVDYHNGYQSPSVWIEPPVAGNVLKVSSNCPQGQYMFYLEGMPASIFVEDDGKPHQMRISSTYSSCNSQDWNLKHFRNTKLKRGWVFINGKDSYDETVRTLANNAKDRFDRAKELALSKGYSDEEIEDIISQSERGEVIYNLNQLREKRMGYTIKEVFKLSSKKNNI